MTSGVESHEMGPLWSIVPHRLIVHSKATRTMTYPPHYRPTYILVNLHDTLNGAIKNSQWTKEPLNMAEKSDIKCFLTHISQEVFIAGHTGS